MDSRTLFAAAIGLCMLNACEKRQPSQSGAQPVQTPAAQPAVAAAAQPAPSAQELFLNRCSPCHGPQGRGDGPAAAALNPKPRDYSDAAWQRSVTDEQIKQTILYGGAAVGKSAVMPSQPDLESKPEALAALIKLVRDFGTTPH